jgi:hypothetical protein
MWRDRYQPNSFNRTLKRLGLVALVLAAAAGAHIINKGNKLIHEREAWKQQQKQKYGTLLNPRYTIKRNLDQLLHQHLDAKTLREIRNIESAFNPSFTEVRDAVRELDKLEKDRSRYPSTLEETEDLISKYKTTTTPHDKDLVDKIGYPLIYCLYSQKNLANFDQPCLKSTSEYKRIADLAKTKAADFDVEVVSITLARFLTGDNFPKTLALLKKKLDEHILGEHSASNETISYKGEGKLREVRTLLHEAGHVAAQHQEDDMRSRIPSRSALEEGSAYAFSDAGIKAMFCLNTYELGLKENGRELALELKIGAEALVSYWVDRYIGGNDDNYMHGEGAASFIATRNVMGNSHTFNTLATVPQSTLKYAAYPIRQELENMVWARKTNSETKERLTKLRKEWEPILRLLFKTRQEIDLGDLNVETSPFNSPYDIKKYFRNKESPGQR